MDGWFASSMEVKRRTLDHQEYVKANWLWNKLHHTIQDERNDSFWNKKNQSIMERYKLWNSTFKANSSYYNKSCFIDLSTPPHLWLDWNGM